MKIRIDNVRLAFPALFEPKAVNAGDKPAFCAAFIVPRNHPQMAEINAAIAATADEKWGVKGPVMLKTIKAGDKIALHDGDGKAQYQGFEGNWFISARNPVRPTCLDADKTPLAESDGRLYAGCYCNAILELWGQDNNYGKRINATLLGVQFYRDGDAFSGGGSASEDDFDDVTSGATSDFM